MFKLDSVWAKLPSARSAGYAVAIADLLPIAEDTQAGHSMPGGGRPQILTCMLRLLVNIETILYLVSSR